MTCCTFLRKREKKINSNLNIVKSQSLLKIPFRDQCQSLPNFLVLLKQSEENKDTPRK